jgi:Holliday junction resolvase-like predicted endonuclease
VKTSWHVATAAEAIAAAQFARLGFDVSVQYGANQPEYDLMIDNGQRTLKVSVKGSKDTGWGLSQSQLSKLRGANYQGAADAWLQRHKPRTILCLVSFLGTALHELPRVYVATPSEIAARLRSAAGGRGDTILYENHQRGPKAAGAGSIEQLPASWLLSETRMGELIAHWDSEETRLC